MQCQYPVDEDQIQEALESLPHLLPEHQFHLLEQEFQEKDMLEQIEEFCF